MGHLGLIPCVAKTNQNVTVTVTVIFYLYEKSLENIAVARKYLNMNINKNMSDIYKTDKSRQNRPTYLKPLYLIQAAKSILVIFR